MVRRCFIGIPLPEHLVRALSEVRSQIETATPTWREARWVGPQNLHVTVEFLGDMDDAAIAHLKTRLDVLFEREWKTPGLDLQRVKAVPSDRRPRMLWAAFDDPDGAATDLADAIVSECEDLVRRDEHRPWKPHATLCRTRRHTTFDEEARKAAELVLSAIPKAMSDLTYTLYSSRLTPSGPVYTALRSWTPGGRSRDS